MNNSVYARFCRNTFMKQRIFIRSYCHKTTSTAESKTETANIAESKFEAINLVKSKSDKIELWREKIMIYMKAYEDMFGITKLKEMHEKVVKAQAALRTVQEGRTEVLEEFFQVQKKLHEKRDILHTTPIEDAKYITIMTQLTEGDFPLIADGPEVAKTGATTIQPEPLTLQTESSSREIPAETVCQHRVTRAGRVSRMPKRLNL